MATLDSWTVAWGPGPVTASVATGAVAAVLSFVLTLVVLRAGQPSAVNRRLALLLAADGVFMAVSVGGTLTSFAPGWRVALGATVVLDAMALIAFISTLETPLGRPFAHRRGAATLAVVGASVLALVVAGEVRGSGFLGFGEVDSPAWITLMFASLYALAASIHAYVRSAKGTLAHRRSAATMRAFVLRDGLLLVVGLTWASADILGWDALKYGVEALGGVALALFVILLTYGILRTQLFDIDLKIKVGISRSTAASFSLAVVFVVSKVVESYASRNLGFVAGAVAAGLLLFAAPRLNKLGDRVANTAMPQVQPTSQYLTFKKLEVYRAAVESALDGDCRIEGPERALLDRLRLKLGLTEADAKALEEEMMPS